MADWTDILSQGIGGYFDSETAKVNASAQVQAAQASALSNYLGSEMMQNNTPFTRAGTMNPQTQTMLLYVGLGVAGLIGLTLVMKSL